MPVLLEQRGVLVGVVSHGQGGAVVSEGLLLIFKQITQLLLFLGRLLPLIPPLDPGMFLLVSLDNLLDVGCRLEQNVLQELEGAEDPVGALQDHLGAGIVAAGGGGDLSQGGGADVADVLVAVPDGGRVEVLLGKILIFS